VGLLLKDGAQPSWTNYEEKPPLLLAALNGHTHIVSILRSHNKPSELEEALCDAAGASHAGVVEHLLQVGISTNSSKTQHQHRLVVGKDHKAIVRLLLNANESHSCPDHAPNDFIPLHHAVRLGQVISQPSCSTTASISKPATLSSGQCFLKHSARLISAT